MVNKFKAMRIIDESNLFKKDTGVYIKKTSHIIDMLVDNTFKHYNILLIDVKYDEMLVFSPTFREENLKSFKFSEMETFRLISSIF